MSAWCAWHVGMGVWEGIHGGPHACVGGREVGGGEGVHEGMHEGVHEGVHAWWVACMVGSVHGGWLEWKQMCLHKHVMWILNE